MRGKKKGGMEGIGEGLPANPPPPPFLHTSAGTCGLTAGRRDGEPALGEHPGSARHPGRRETPARTSPEQLLTLSYPKKNPTSPTPAFAMSAVTGTERPAEIKRTANCNQPLQTPQFPIAPQSPQRPGEEIPFRQRKELSPSYRIIL